MPKLKNLSGNDIVAVLALFGFAISTQRGSHVKLKRINGGTSQTLTVPLHKEMDKGTLKAIYSQASRYVPESGLRPHFYSE
jgi:predicted RNA binding protein YcfA (HicA-like mRNA interferase family)